MVYTTPSNNLHSNTSICRPGAVTIRHMRRGLMHKDELWVWKVIRHFLFGLPPTTIVGHSA